MDAQYLIPGNKYLIDPTFNNGGVIEIVSVGTMFCKVKDPDTNGEWETMCHRISQIPEWIHKILSTPAPAATSIRSAEGYGKLFDDNCQIFHDAVNLKAIDRTRFIEIASQFSQQRLTSDDIDKLFDKYADVTGNAESNFNTALSRTALKHLLEEIENKRV